MADIRAKKAKLNISTSLISQFVILLCGLVVPRLMIKAFGSEAYGATTSIAQFLAYISLLEGGIGGVARAALYKPLAQNNIELISAVVSEIKRFFRIISYIFLAYVVVLAISFKSISDIESLNWISTFLLVLVISISTFAQYFIGISYAVLFQAAQKTYVTNFVQIITTVLNTVLVILLIFCDCNLILVKLVSSCVFVLRPIIMWLIVKKDYKLVAVKQKNSGLLSQKWVGLGQHIAYFLHTNTDVAVLTVFANVLLVAVYSVYNMIVANIQNFAMSFLSGMEALFGDMLAKKEFKLLQKVFGFYETLISVISVFLFSVTAVLIVPFVKLYTQGITDADYIAPKFAMLLILSALVHCLRMPYHSVVIAAGHFKQTQIAAYGEAAINILLSIVLVIKFSLIGVAIGTLVATVFRFLFYVYYLSKNIFNRSMLLFAKRTVVNAGTFCISFYLGYRALSYFEILSYIDWAKVAILVSLIAACIVLLSNFIFYSSDIVNIAKKTVRKN